MTRWVCAALLACLPALTAAQQGKLRDGDRVVFYGDSITAQRLYTRFVEDFVLTREPMLRVAFFNAGVPGDTAHGGYTGDTATRLKRDVLPHAPTVVTVMLGMNDGYYMPFNQEYLSAYKRDYRALVATLQTRLPAARITLAAPTPYDELTHGSGGFPHYSEVVARHAAYDRELATELHVDFCDFGAPVSALLRTAIERNPSLATLLIPDRIHPSAAAHWVMAAALARAWGLSPVVSSVQIDARGVRVATAENATIDGLAASESGLHWIQTDRSLPLPLPLDDPMLQFVLGISDLETMDRQILRVENLPAPRYALVIDTTKVGEFSREELAQGVNLALHVTPMLNQAETVDQLERARTQLEDARFVLCIEGSGPQCDQIEPALREKDAALLAQQRKAAQPSAHTFTLTAR